MDFKEYINATFPGLQLKPSLYDQWEIGLHFEFAQGIYQFIDDGTLNLERFTTVYTQALDIFDFLFSEHDEIFLVANVTNHITLKKRTKPKKVFLRFLKNKNMKYQLKHSTLPYVHEDEEDTDRFYTSQFSLKCKRKDLQHSLLIKAACNEDFPLKPKFSGGKWFYYPDVFFINITKQLIFFIYDDRGCEVIAAKKETLQTVYNHYKELIGEYDRERLGQIFES